MQPESAKPFLRWAGSKRKILSTLIQFAPNEFTRYIEPFAGSACLYFSLAPRKAVLSDLNSDLMQTYRAVRDEPIQVGTLLEEMSVGSAAYYKIRSQAPLSLTKTARAARFIYLNRFCFNGLYRTNTKGEFNVPYGAPKNYIVPTIAELKRCAKSLKQATLAVGDFENVVRKQVRAGDFVYLDPPFYQRAQRVFREYNADPFHALDLVRLSQLLTYIDNAGARFVVSYSDCQEAREAFGGWSCTKIQVTRNISGFIRHRRIATELVIANLPRVPRTRKKS